MKETTPVRRGARLAGRVALASVTLSIALATATPVAPSPISGRFLADIGIGWQNLGKGRWTWKGTFVGLYPPPAKPTAARGAWAPSEKGWTRSPGGSRKWTFAGSFHGPSPPSPPGPQSGSFGAFAGTWVVESKSLAGTTWTWHGTWTGQVPIR